MGPNEIIYSVSAGAANAAPARLEGEALRWTVVDNQTDAADALFVSPVTLDPQTEWLMRCDRVEFEPGGIAYTHTHPGPGIRFLLLGEITIESGGRVSTYGPGQAWFELGPEPVLATTSPSEPSAFARALLLPVAYAGQRTIRYLDPADAEKPKTQKATIFCEVPLVRT